MYYPLLIIFFFYTNRILAAPTVTTVELEITKSIMRSDGKQHKSIKFDKNQRKWRNTYKKKLFAMLSFFCVDFHNFSLTLIVLMKNFCFFFAVALKMTQRDPKMFPRWPILSQPQEFCAELSYCPLSRQFAEEYFFIASTRTFNELYWWVRKLLVMISNSWILLTRKFRIIPGRCSVHNDQGSLQDLSQAATVHKTTPEAHHGLHGQQHSFVQETKELGG